MKAFLIQNQIKIVFLIFSYAVPSFGQQYNYQEITPNINLDNPSKERVMALNIYKRLVGVTTPLDNPILDEMENALANNDPMGAANIATSEQGFLNNTVRDLAAKMSTREETVKTDLNDFVATFIGVVRDNIDARQLLNGSFFYHANDQVNVANNIAEDIVQSNNHYLELEQNLHDFASVLTRSENQFLRTSNGSLIQHPDPAGLLTSRAFMEAHASAGTNRRLVEYTMREFTCNPIENWSDSTSPDLRVGRDVERFPGGDPQKFQTTCKACHANLDGFKGAFARFDFSDNFTKYATLYPDGDGENEMPQAPLGISAKVNQNNDVFPSGFPIVDDSWENFARSPSNLKLFGWRGSSKAGSGVQQFANLISNSKAFSQCMVKRVFRELCRRNLETFESDFLVQSSSDFENDNYNLKNLFQTVAISTNCQGKLEDL